MCGILGIRANLDNKDIFLKRMMEAMSQRGPDSQGKYIESEVALGHLRLKIIDLSPNGDQPFFNENKDISLVANAEIYNFVGLRKELESKGHRFRSFSDNEVILHAYEEWGVSCLERLRGMFAFCIWDEKRKKMFLARDRLGIKPLYYYYKNGIFIFASQVRAILSSGLVPKNLSFNGLETYLDYGAIKEPMTIIEDIFSVLPASYMIFERNELRIEQYWDPLKVKSLNADIKFEELSERIRLLLEESIKIHLVSDVPIGIFLSGGIDSSSLVNMAAKVSPDLKTVSAIFKEKEFNEAFFSRKVAQRYRTLHREVLITDKEVFRNFDYCLEAMDEPTFNGINTYFISQAARQTNLKVALSGLGGDELFCGYPGFKRIGKLIRFSAIWNRLPRHLRGILSKSYKMFSPDTTANRKIYDFLRQSYNRHPYFWTRMLFSEEEKIGLSKRPFKIKSQDSNQSPDFEKLDIINQISFLEIKNYMVDILLRDTDFMSMAHSLEVRVPLLDHKLVEFIFSIPAKFKIGGRYPKRLLVNSLVSPLPQEVFRRPKMGFVLPFDCWLRGKLKGQVEEALREKGTILEDVLDQKAIWGIWEKFLSRRVSWQRPWAIYVLKKWVNNYLK